MLFAVKSNKKTNHLGGGLVPIELKPDHLKIEPDHVLADLLRAMHLIVHAVDESFEPENGAHATGGYGSSRGGHSHGDHVHVHEHKPDGHGHDYGHSH